MKKFKQAQVNGGSNYDSLKLRTNTFGVNVALRHADNAVLADCRHCKVKLETLGHMLGECVAGKSMRIHRHNEAVLKIADEANRKGFTGTHEESFRVGERTLKPDLVLTGKEGAFVVDVTVRYESKGYLDNASK